MADHTQVLQQMKHKEGVSYPVLVPNVEGFHKAVEAGAKEIAIFAGNSHSYKNRINNRSCNDSWWKLVYCYLIGYLCIIPPF